MAAEIVATKVLHQGWSTLLAATLRLPDGSTMKREIEHHGDAAAVLPYDPDRRTALLVRQLRPPVLHASGTASLLEAIAGMVDGEDPAVCAKREAWEEAGVKLEALERIATAWSTPGVSTERISLYLAAYSRAARSGAGGGLTDEHEAITVVEMQLDALAALVEAGDLADMKTLVLVQTLRLRRPDLFRGHDRPRRGA